jgi:hypothetical protein
MAKPCVVPSQGKVYNAASSHGLIPGDTVDIYPEFIYPMGFLK